MDRQPEIDRICEWMKLHKEPAHPVLYRDENGEMIWDWADERGMRLYRQDFNPFTNPSDTATVMDEVVKRGNLVISMVDSDGGIVYIKPNPGKFFRGDGKTES